MRLGKIMRLGKTGRIRSTSLRWRLAAVALVAAVSAAVAAGPAAAEGIQGNDGPQCPNGNFCYWSETNYGGTLKGVWSDAFAGSYVGSQFDFFSAKNSFGNRRVQMQARNSTFVKCMDPGETDPVMVAFLAFKIGAPGTRC